MGRGIAGGMLGTFTYKITLDNVHHQAYTLTMKHDKMTLYIDQETRLMAGKLAFKNDDKISAYLRKLIRREYRKQFEVSKN